MLLRLHPDKKSDKYAPDLVVDGRVADLKSPRTPFFKAGVMYGVDPQYAVTLNTSDVDRYRYDCPIHDLYFWVDWKETKRTIGGVKYEVVPMAGVWRISFPDLEELIESRSVEPHEYASRADQDIPINAKSSHVLDLRDFELLDYLRKPWFKRRDMR